MSKSKKPAIAETKPAELKEEATLVPCCGEETCLDCIVPEETEMPLEDAASTASPEQADAAPESVYTVEDGDTYAGIAKRFKPEGSTVNEYANHLAGVNKNRPLLPGAIIRL